MDRHTVTVARHSPASPEEVWALLADVAGWPDWAPVRAAELEAEGADHPDGLGAVRVLRTALGVAREEIVAFEPGRHLGYVLLSGLPARQYRSDVVLVRAPRGGTDITWQSTFESSWLWYRLVRMRVRRSCRALARAAHPAGVPV